MDGEGKLVVELKRTEKGGHAELQAIRYAAMLSNMTKDRIVKAHSSFLKEHEDEAKVNDKGLITEAAAIETPSGVMDAAEILDDGLASLMQAYHAAREHERELATGVSTKSKQRLGDWGIV